MPLCEIQRRDRLNQPASWKQETGAKVCLSRDWSLNGSLLIDIVRERKRNADGVCPCGFHVSGNEETNVESVSKIVEIVQAVGRKTDG